MDIDNLQIENIQFSKSFSINTTNKKISIGYNNQLDLHILTPIFTSGMNYLPLINYQSLKCNFEPMLGPMFKFYNIIYQIEQRIKQHILKHNNDYILSTIIKNDKVDLFDDSIEDYTKYMSLHINNDLKYYNNNNEETTLNDLRINFKFKALLKIDSIWINTQTKKFGLKIEPIQIKIIKPISMSKCLIDNNQTQINEYIHKKQIQVVDNQPLVINKQTNNIVVQSQININKSIFIPPEPSQLLQLKNSLKKIIE